MQYPLQATATSSGAWEEVAFAKGGQDRARKAAGLIHKRQSLPLLATQCVMRKRELKGGISMQRTTLLASISALALTFAGAAHAQEAQQTNPTAADASDAEGDVVVVTGSRIARRDYQSTSPISTIDNEILTEGPLVNVENALNQLPQFVQGQNQSAIGAVAGGGRATLNLRGLGETRNLVLLDGRRLPLSSAFGVVDVNMLPSNIIQSVETITGGASAVYGSDAMSGVVNFKTFQEFDGLQFDARMSDSFDGGGGTAELSVLGGAETGDGRASAVIAMSYSDRDVLWGHKRPDFFGQGVLSSFIGQGTFVPSATNLPLQATVDSVFAGYGIAAGTVLNSRSLGFNDDGTLFQQIGANNYKGPTTQLFSTLGNIVRQPVTMQEYLTQPMERRNIYASFDYDFSEGLTFYSQLLHTRSVVEGQVGWSPTLFVVPTMPVSNPFIPTALRTILASRPTPGADFTLNQRFMGFEDRKFRSDVNVGRYVVGLRGDVGFSDWTFDIYGLHDNMDLVETQDKALLNSRLRNLLYAADGGASICAGGYNPFGLNKSIGVSAACRAYVETETHDYTQTTQDVVEANITGSVFSLPAGDVKVSLTGTYRENAFEFDPDAARENADIIGTLLTAPSQGDVSVSEIAGEVLIPILKDAPFAHSLEVNLGYRISDYDVTGSFDTYKADVAWKPIEPLLIRGGYERAIRAPNIGELYSAAQAAQAQIGSPPSAGDPCDVRTTSRTGSTGTSVRGLCVATGVPASIVDTYQYTTVAVGAVASGSTLLTPEEADTFTIGAVWRPASSNALLANLSFSVDYYDIEVSNVISQVSAVTTMNKCYNLDGSNPTYDANNLYCRLITRDGTGGISTVSTPYLNLGGIRTSGIDVQADWGVDLQDSLALPGQIDLNFVVNFLNKYEVQILPGSSWVDYSGTIDGTQAATTPPVGLPLPEYKLFANLNYSVGPAEVGLRWRYLPEMDDVTSVTRPASPAAGVDSYHLFDLNLGWNFSEDLAIRGGITNLFDEDPVQIAGTPGLTQPGTYDIIGRSYYLALTKRF